MPLIGPAKEIHDLWTAFDQATGEQKVKLGCDIVAWFGGYVGTRHTCHLLGVTVEALNATIAKSGITPFPSSIIPNQRYFNQDMIDALRKCL